MPQEAPPVVADISDTMRTTYVGFASFAILIWDHIDTFVDEVEYIWKGERKGIFVYLFLFNRYFTPLAFIINLYAYLSPVWTFERCSHFVRYQGCTFLVAVQIVGIMMLLRINALYPRQKWICRGLALLLIFETVMIGWLTSHGEPLLHNPNSGMHACSMVFDPSINLGAASAAAWIPLLYDTIIFGLTLYRTVPPILREDASYVFKRLLEDGVLYYSVIFSVTLVWTIMIVAAPPATKNTLSHTELLVAVAMMSRITINLKRAGDPYRDDTTSVPEPIRFTQGRHGRYPSFANFLGRSFDVSMSDSEASRTIQQTSPNTTDDIVEHPPFSRAGHHDPIDKPPPLVIAPSNMNPHIPVV